MQVIEIHFEGERSVLAVSHGKEKINEHLELLKEAGLANLTLKTVPLEGFPVYAVETHKIDDAGSEHNHFEYVDEQGYVQMIQMQKQHRVEDNFHVYFTAYYFEEEYFQQEPGHHHMDYLDHAQVDNYFLNDEDVEKGLAHSRISRLAGRWDLDGLDKLFTRYMASGSPAEKEELAYHGYLSVFAQMDYDFACGKLTDAGISLLIPIAEKISMLVGKEQWDVYSRAYMMLLEDAIEKHEDKVEHYFNEAERAVQANMLDSLEDQQESYKQLAQINDMLAEYYYFDDKHWHRALEFINTSIALDPAEGDWFTYLQLIYIPYDVRKNKRMEGLTEPEIKERYKKWHELRDNEIIKFRALGISQNDSRHAVALNIALAYKRLREYVEWYALADSLFPEHDYQYWLNEAVNWKKQKTTRMQLTEAGHFFHAEGNRYKRIDLLETAVAHFQRLIEQVVDAPFEVYYKASALEDISDIYFSKNNHNEGVNYRNQATQCYRDHISLVEGNPSVFMHYTEYLERCYIHPADIIKPAMAELEALAAISEDQGEGMYSSPVMLRIRLALLQEDEGEALYHIVKSLILFELSMEDHIKELVQMPQIRGFKKLYALLNDTLAFFDEIREGYYLDTKIKWAQLREMTPQEVFEAWEERKEALRNREKIAWS
ncbi:hypothetical protein GCM10009122_25310 [Fulvivirga kasyanovii]|uniref:DUF4034 domain-containing protein n=1 Tax=Fulvivirga kasyanovii TaxID=396812 RepID=A0ABW9RM80_9BACT|nr:hypothetical protein [Fulvivirga kasyanovii]MTI25123.1 hypothetical protein [Fulvivirga kasyanovii]